MGRWEAQKRWAVQAQSGYSESEEEPHRAQGELLLCRKSVWDHNLPTAQAEHIDAEVKPIDLQGLSKQVYSEVRHC